MSRTSGWRHGAKAPGAFVSLTHCAPTGLGSVPLQWGLGERENTLLKFLRAQRVSLLRIRVRLPGFFGYEATSSHAEKFDRNSSVLTSVAFTRVCHGDSGSVGTSLCFPGYSPESSFGDLMSKGRQLGEKTV